MLRILAVILSVSLLLSPVFAMAGFFDEEDKLVQENACSECESKVANLNPGLMEKVREIESKVSNNLSKEESPYNNEIILFIDFINSSSDAAVNALVKFKKDNPSWKVSGVVVGKHKDLKEELLQKQKFFSNGIEFNIDLSGSLANEFGIFKTPTYLIIYNGKQHKFIGQFDLDETISKLNK